MRASINQADAALVPNVPAQRGEFPYGHYTCSKATILRLNEIARHPLTKVTSGTYYFPVFTADEYGSLERYKLGAVEFERTRSFFERTAVDWENLIAANMLIGLRRQKHRVRDSTVIIFEAIIRT